MTTRLPEEPKPHPGSAGLLQQADIDEFKRLAKEILGVELTNYQAWTRATQLVAMYRMLIKPIPEDPEAHTQRGPEQGRPDPAHPNSR